MHLSRIVRSVLLLALGAAPLAAQARPLDGALRAALAPAARVTEFSGTVLIRRRDREVGAASFGDAIREFGVPNRRDTRFMIGSIGKQFTAAAVLLLVDRGLLTLDTPLATWLPTFPHAREITIRQMLEHRSGISRDLPGGLATLRQSRTLPEMVALIATDSLRFAPGTDEAYSNNAYRVLAYVVERVSGRSYADFLQREFFGPLGMTHTGQLESNTLVPRLAQGYVPGFGPAGFGPASFADISNGVGAGSLYSTVDDMARWLERFLRDGALYPRVRDLMLEGEGRGVVVANYEGHRVIWHDGVYQGYTALAAVFPNDSLTVVYLGNTETLLSEGPLRRTLYGVAFRTPTAPLAAPAIGRAPLPRPASHYTGSYDFFPGLSVTVTAHGDGLLLEGLPLEHLGGGTFYYRLKGARVVFDTTATPAAQLLWTDPAGTYPGKRSPAAP